MINRKNHYIAIFCTLALFSSLGISARFHEVNSIKKMDKGSLTEESSETGRGQKAISNETIKTKQETDNDKKIEIISYAVKTGDSIGTISSLYGVSSETVAESNGISVDAVLLEGQILKFPSVNGVLYKIGNNETLSDIASTYKIDVNELLKTNSLGTSEKVSINQEIIIPEAKKILAIKGSNNEILLAKSEETKSTLSRGGAVSTTAKAVSLQVRWPIKGTISSRFGMRNGRMHTGIDISAPYGSIIAAALDGKVIFNGWQDGYGKLLIIQHKNGLQTYYAHNSEIVVQVGESVSAGQKVSKIGTTGRTTGPHVHFEVRKNGNPDNPLNYLN